MPGGYAHSGLAFTEGNAGQTSPRPSAWYMRKDIFSPAHSTGEAILRSRCALFQEHTINGGIGYLLRLCFYHLFLLILRGDWFQN